MNKLRDPATFLPDRLDGIARSVSRTMASSFEQSFGISLPEWHVIAAVGRSPGLAAVDVAERTVLDKVAVSRAVATLVDRGILARQRADTDRRRSALSLTARGKTLRASLESLAQQIETDLLEDLSKSEVDALFRLLDRLETRSQKPRRAG